MLSYSFFKVSILRGIPGRKVPEARTKTRLNRVLYKHLPWKGSKRLMQSVRNKDTSATEHSGHLIHCALVSHRGSGLFFTLLVKESFLLWECETSNLFRYNYASLSSYVLWGSWLQPPLPYLETRSLTISSPNLGRSQGQLGLWPWNLC